MPRVTRPIPDPTDSEDIDHDQTSNRDHNGDDLSPNTVDAESVDVDGAEIASSLGIPVYTDDANAPNGTQYFDDTDGGLEYKDADGVIFAGGGLEDGENFDGQGTSEFTNLSSVSTTGAEIAGRPTRAPITAESTVTETLGRNIDVAGTAIEVILDVSEATVVYGGVVNGRSGALGLTVDGTEISVADTSRDPVGQDGSDNRFTSETIPFAVAESSVKVELFNSHPSTHTYGYKLWTEGWSP